MFVVIYRYKVPSNMSKQYLELMSKTADLYAKHDCLGYEIFEDAQHKGDWLEINSLRNKRTIRKSMPQSTRTPELKLYGENSAPSHACKILEVEVIDETGSIALVLWDEKILPLRVGETLQIKNGFINSFKGEWRTNVGKYGDATKI